MSLHANVEHEPIPQGTLDMLILQTITAARGELHGFERAASRER